MTSDSTIARIEGGEKRHGGLIPQGERSTRELGWLRKGKGAKSRHCLPLG